MADLKILFWNVEHFDAKGGGSEKRKERVGDVCDFIQTEAPDVFGIAEVKGNVVFEKMTTLLADYSFMITEGPQTQEILIGVKHDTRFFFTQKSEFKSGNPNLRPAGLLTVTFNGHNVPILFTHLKSMPSPVGFGLRNDMVERIKGLKSSLDKAVQGLRGDPSARSHFIVLGDMNTMGMTLKDSAHDISAQEELATISRRMMRSGMVLLPKSHPATFNNGSGSSYPPSDLDHVFAADHLVFREFGDDGASVRVAGWAEIDDVAGRDGWIDRFSDHAPLIMALQLP